MDEHPALETLRTAARALKGEIGELDGLRAVQAAQDALDAAKAELVGRVEETRLYETEEASSVQTWCRRELRLSAGTTHTLVRAAHTLRALPEMAEAARCGRVRLEHLRTFN